MVVILKQLFIETIHWLPVLSFANDAVIFVCKNVDDFVHLCRLIKFDIL